MRFHQSLPSRKLQNQMDGFITSSISFLLLRTESPQIVLSFEIIKPVVFSGSETWHISMGSSAHSLRVWNEMSARTMATSETRDPHLLLRGISSSLDWDSQFSAGQLPGPQILEATLYLPPQFACSLLWPTGCSSPQIPHARPLRSGCPFVEHPTLPNQGGGPVMLTHSFQTLFCP